MKKRVTIVSIIILIILCIAFCDISLSNSNDTFYLIKLGESISKNGIDMIDHFSWISALPYSYPHWLYSIFLFLIYNNFGYYGIYISTVICFITLILVIYFVNRKINKDSFLALVISIISIVPLSLFAYPRAQLISIIIMVLEIYFISQLINNGSKKYIVFLAICSLVIANVHATIWIAFFVFFFPFFGEHLVYLYCEKKNKKITFNGRISCKKINNIKLVTIAFIICFLMGLLSPSRICYTYFIKIALGDSQLYITEHFPLVIIKYPLVILMCFFLFFSKSKIKLSEFFMICGIVLMTFMAQRHLIFFCTIGLLYFSIILKRNLDEIKDRTFQILERKLFNSVFAIVIVIVIPLVICYFRINENIKNGFIDNNVYPVDAVNYIKENLDYKNIKIINDYNFGSYLLFNDIKVFVDSRCDLYYKEFNNKNMDILDDFFEMNSFEKKYDYDNYLQKYHADYFLLDNTTPIFYMLKNDSRYKEVYIDEKFGLFQKINSK